MSMIFTLRLPTDEATTAIVAASTNPLLACLDLERMLDYDGDYNYWADILVHVEALIPGRAAPLKFEAIYVYCAGPNLQSLSASDAAEAEAIERIAAALRPAMDAAVWQRYVELVDEAVADGRIRPYAGIRQSERARVSRTMAAVAA